MIKHFIENTKLRSLFLAFSLIYSITIIAQNEPFITTWIPGEDGEILINTNEDYTYLYDVVVTYNNGSVMYIFSDQTNDLNIYDLPTDANVTVEISGTFPTICFWGTGDNAKDIRDITQWGSIEWKTMDCSFYNCSNLTCSATDTPNVSNVIYMDAVFYGASNFNADISDWDVSSAINMLYMFYGANSFNGDISNWDVSNVTTMAGMFYGASSFNGDISSWDVSNVTNMNNMFYGATLFNQDLSSWDAMQNIDREEMFTDAGDVYYTITYDIDGTQTLGFYPKEHSDITLKTLDTKEGVPFTGWNTTSDFSSDFITNLAEGITEDITLYAHWGEPTFTIHPQEVNALNVYPNPVTNILYINGENLKGKYITLYNSTGEIINRINTQSTINTSFDISDYPSGLYIMQYSNGDGKMGNVKIIKN